MSIGKRIKKVEFIIQSIVNAYFIADQNSKLLEPLLYDKNVYSKWDGTPGVDGVSAMRMALYMHVLSDMRAILFDPDPKVASMVNIIKALEDDSFVKALKAKFCKPNGVQVCGDQSEDEKSWLTDVIQKEDIEQKEIIFGETLEKLVSGFSELQKSEIGSRINTARSKMISHKQVTSVASERKLFDAKDFGLSFRDAMDIIELSKEVIFNANLLITNSSYDLTSFVGHHKLVATQFWEQCKNA